MGKDLRRGDADGHVSGDVWEPGSWARSAGSRLRMIAALPRGRFHSPPHEWMRSRRVVEKKEETKKRLGRSPDDMDALNLAYYEFGWEAPYAIAVPVYDERPLGPQSDDVWNDIGPTSLSRRPRFG